MYRKACLKLDHDRPIRSCEQIMTFEIENMNGRRSSLLTRETGFKCRVGEIVTICHQLATDATLHSVPWRKLRRWAAPTRYT